MPLPIGVADAVEGLNAVKAQDRTGITGPISVITKIDIVKGGKALDIKRRELRFENGVLVDIGEAVGTQHNLGE